MSAIWGCIDLSGKNIETDLPNRMSECIKKYKIDRTEHLLRSNVYMACGIQYITEEAKREKLPTVYENIYFTADCIIDNRQELLDTLDMNDNSTDSELLFCAWKRWGESFGDYVLGLFSFAVFDKYKNEFYLYTDHTSSRCVHYYTDGNRIYFATLTSSIIDAVKDIKISEKWMTACMSTSFPSMLLFPGLTPYENVYILQYGCGIKVTLEKDELLIENKRYWNPLKTIKPMWRFDDKRCRHMFRDTFFKCVKDAIRTDGEVGVFLSSGLDSSSIAGTAAKMLKEKKKNLYSYTSIPLQEFDTKHDNDNGFWIDDETKGVKCICNCYENILPRFMECRGKSVLTYIEEFCNYLEFPGKALINHVWMKDGYNEARKDGCRIILDGGYGNWSISYGSIMENVYLMAHRGNILEAIKQLIILSDKEKLMKKRLILHFFKGLFTPINYKDGLNIDKEYFRSDLVEKYKIEQYWERRLKKEGISRCTLSQRRNTLVAGLLFQLLGMYETKDGLYNGLLVRDPSKDKRIIELCLKIPYKCFAWNGVERRLIREYLDDIVPDEIRLRNNKRGRQSGDAALRYEMYGLPNGCNTWDELGDKLRNYYDLEKAEMLLKEKTDLNNITAKSKILACNYFLKKWG